MRTRPIIIVAVILAIVFLIRAVDKTPSVPDMTYHDALSRTASGAVPWIHHGGPEEAEAFARFKEFWSDLNEESIRARLPGVYAPELWFNDTVRTITTLEDLLDYMLVTAGHVQSCRVEIKDIASTDEGYYARWEMTIVPRNANAGEVWSSIGLTHLRFNADGRVIFHQDYWDAAGGLYEHFPVVGWLIRNIRARL